MGRPRYEMGDITARDRIVAAWWSMLASEPLQNLTVRGVSSEAGVNHNTFYRHFENIEDLAKEAFNELVLTHVPEILLCGNGSIPILSPSQVDSLRKVRLYASSKSTLLEGILCDGLENTWLCAAGVGHEDLTNEQKMDCGVIFNGLVHALGSEEFDVRGDLISNMLSRPLGQGMLKTLEGIAQENSKTRSKN